MNHKLKFQYLKTFPVICVASLIMFAWSAIRLDDFFLYLTFGRMLFTDGGFSPTDSLIFTIKDYHWELWHEWLSYVYYYFVYLLGGYQGVVILRGVWLGLLGAVIWKTCARAKLSYSVSFATFTGALLAAAPRIFRDRSSFFTDLFLVLLIFILTDARSHRENGRWKWFVPPLFLIWVQWHSAYVMGWFFVSLFILINWTSLSQRNRREWVFVGALCALLPLLNPNGLNGVLWPLKAIFASEWGVLGQIAEFTPTLRAEFLPWPYKVFLLCFMGVALLITGLNRKSDGGWFAFGAALTLAALGVRFSRLVAFSGLGLGILLATSLGSSTWAWPKLARPWMDRLAFGLAIIIALAIAISENHGPRFLLAQKPLHEAVPVSALDFLMEQPAGNTFNEWQVGSYLAWRLNGRQKIGAHGFISDTKLVEKNIYRFSQTREGWQEIILNADVKYFVLRRQTFEESRQAAWIKELEGPDWLAIYADPAAVIFARR